jgi:predicted RNA-binding protein YlqC (UPF0109 family)
VHAREYFMKDLIEYIAKALVEEPDEVSVECLEDSDNSYELYVSADDRGKIIGRKGRTVNAIRTVLAAAVGEGHDARLEVVD